MTPSLAREQFIERVWSSSDLDAVAEFWMRLYENAAKANSFSPTPQHQTELRLRGFPRADQDRLAHLAATRAAAADFGFPHVSHPDPDTLSLTTTPFDGGDAPPAGLGLPIVATDEFDGLVIEIRFTAQEERGKGLSTIVLAGELRAGSFNLMAVWRAGLSKWDDELVQFAPWIHESAFLTALDEFRSSGAVPPKLAKKLFQPRGADRVGALVASAFIVPLGKPRLVGLLIRTLVFAGLLAACGVGGYRLWETGDRLWLAPIAFLTIIIAWLASLFVRTELRVWRIGYTQLRALYTEFDQETPKLIPVNQSESAKFDPYVRKYTADLTAAGFTFLGETRLAPVAIGEVIFRIFSAPDGTTYLSVVHQRTNTIEAEKHYRFWPAFTSFVCHTFLTGGGYAASMNGPRHGYSRKRSGPECLARIFPEEHDPVQFAQLHAEAVAKFAARTGNAPLHVTRFEEHLRLRNALAEEERRLDDGKPFTLGDHLHWYLQIPRRAFRE